jgi:DNA-binding CsgD family transcriptional regulator
MQQLLVIEEDKLDEISLDKQSKSAKALQLVAQGTPVEAIADEFEITFEAAVLLEDIAVRLNQFLVNHSNCEAFNQLQLQEVQCINCMDCLDRLLSFPKVPDSCKTMNGNFDAPHSVNEGGLTSRQREVLYLFASGFSTREIAESLFLSVKTIETHRQNIMDRLNIHSLAGLVRHAIHMGLID